MKEEEEEEEEEKEEEEEDHFIMGEVEKSPTSGRPWKVEDGGGDRR